MIAAVLTEPASSSDASTLAGMLVVLGLLGIAMLWAHLTPPRHPDIASMARHTRMTEGLARSVASHPAGGSTRTRPQDVVCRYCGVRADPRETGEYGLCLSPECWDRAVADQITIDHAGHGS